MEDQESAATSGNTFATGMRTQQDGLMALAATVELHPDRLLPAEPGTTRRLDPGVAVAEAEAKGVELDFAVFAVLNVFAPGLGNDQEFVDAALRQARAIPLTSLPERAVDNPGSRNGDSLWQS